MTADERSRCTVQGPAGEGVADTGAVTEVHLKGRLVCRDEREAALVADHLLRHIELTRAEQGCRSFTVTPTEDRPVWRVEEVFDDAASFRRHQDRVQGSAWGAATANIERDYSITGI